ncbi:MAG: hypothetical protein ACK559_11480, partial [bacterium]
DGLQDGWWFPVPVRDGNSWTLKRVGRLQACFRLFTEACDPLSQPGAGQSAAAGSGQLCGG